MGETTEAIRKIQEANPDRERGETLADMEKQDNDNFCHLLADSIEVPFASPRDYMHWARNATAGILKYMGVDIDAASRRAQIAMNNSPGAKDYKTFIEHWYPKYMEKELKKHFVKVEDRPPNEDEDQPDFKDGGTFFVKRGEVIGFISAMVRPLVVTHTRRYYCRTNIKVGGFEKLIFS